MRIAIVDDEGSFAKDVKKNIEKYFSNQRNVNFISMIFYI